MDKEQLIAFEDRVAEAFNNKEIPFPVHLDEGNEEQLIKIFDTVREGDAIFGSWRMHYKALLAGVPEEVLMAAIKRGESMSLRLPEYKVWGSAIVGGIVPIATGYAMANMMQNNSGHTWCFIGDMTRMTGLAEECIRYAYHFQLPITYVTEDNGKSVLTDTAKVCGRGAEVKYRNEWLFEYQSKYPHAGAGVRVQF